jgi:hypothetical protein
MRSVCRRRWVIAGTAACTLLAVLGDARPASPQAPAVKRPDFQVRRFDEDWSVLRGVDRERTDDVWDRFKFIPLTADESVWLSLGGQARERAEYFHRFLFGTSQPKQTDAYLLSRFRLSADLHVTEHVRLFAEAKSAFALDRDLAGGRTPAFVDEVTLQNGFADLNFRAGDAARVTLRGGRQELIFGGQRLVGVSDFTNVRRTFDGAAAIVRVGDWTVTPLWAQLVVVDKYRFDTSTPDHQLFGAYGTGRTPILPLNLDLYWLAVDNRGVTVNGTTGPERRHTLGGRLWGRIGASGLDVEVEGASQFGTLGSGTVAAAMFTAVVGYSLPVPLLTPRVYVEFDYASGDKRPGGDVGTFNQLYPTAHSFLGYIDYIGRQNVVSASAGLTLTPLRGLSLSLQPYAFWRDSTRDAVYTAAGGVLRPGTGTDARYVGAELDLLATYGVTRHLLTYAGWSRFFAGEFIRRTGPHRDSDFVYAAIQYTF